MSSIKGFPERLKAARIASGQTQEQLGFAVDVTKSSVSAWENGREMPSLRNLPKLRVALGCSLDYLVCGSPFIYEGEAKVASDRKNYIAARDANEAALLTKFREMPVKQRKGLLVLMKQDN